MLPTIPQQRSASACSLVPLNPPKNLHRRVITTTDTAPHISTEQLFARLQQLESLCSDLKHQMSVKNNTNQLLEAKVAKSLRTQRELTKTVANLEFRLEFLHSKVTLLETDLASSRASSASGRRLSNRESSEESIPADDDCLKPASPIADTSIQFPYDMTVIHHRINELNAAAGENESVVDVVDGKSCLKFPEKLEIAVYCDGITLKKGPLRRFSDHATKLFMRDIIDGYFPYELKHLYPEGVPFKLKDCHENTHESMHAKFMAFSGRGHHLNFTRADNAIENNNLKQPTSSETNHLRASRVNFFASKSLSNMAFQAPQFNYFAAKDTRFLAPSPSSLALFEEQRQLAASIPAGHKLLKVRHQSLEFVCVAPNKWTHAELKKALDPFVLQEGPATTWVMYTTGMGSGGNHGKALLISEHSSRESVDSLHTRTFFRIIAKERVKQTE
ncbi:UBX domain-containing protein 11 [Chytriomyces hyalinus]|nr:UBX domain-containing protein 11 [Chytriomyces hyalinus]